jgi:hypothetical protein
MMCTANSDETLHRMYVYSLPPDLLNTLTPRNLVDHTNQPLGNHNPERVVATSSGGPRTCNICLGATFLDLEEQRNHFRSDWHRYNVKTHLNGAISISETTFTQLIDGTS